MANFIIEDPYASGSAEWSPAPDPEPTPNIPDPYESGSPSWYSDSSDEEEEDKRRKEAEKKAKEEKARKEKEERERKEKEEAEKKAKEEEEKKAKEEAEKKAKEEEDDNPDKGGNGYQNYYYNKGGVHAVDPMDDDIDNSTDGGNHDAHIKEKKAKEEKEKKEKEEREEEEKKKREEKEREEREAKEREKEKEKEEEGKKEEEDLVKEVEQATKFSPEDKDNSNVDINQNTLSNKYDNIVFSHNSKSFEFLPQFIDHGRIKSNYEEPNFENIMQAMKNAFESLLPLLPGKLVKNPVSDHFLKQLIQDELKSSYKKRKRDKDDDDENNDNKKNRDEDDLIPAKLLGSGGGGSGYSSEPLREFSEFPPKDAVHDHVYEALKNAFCDKIEENEDYMLGGI